MEEVKEFTTEEKRQLFEKVLKDAQWLREKMAGQMFKLREMNRMTQMPIAKCQHMLNYLGKFYLIGVIQQAGGEKGYVVKIDPVWRLKQMRERRAAIIIEHESELSWIDDLIDITSETGDKEVAVGSDSKQEQPEENGSGKEEGRVIEMRPLEEGQGEHKE